MSNERNDSGMDPKVSGAYREIADEQTPEHLNREVLRLAARDVKTPYWAMRTWVRPAAWAATIGLSLVLVLQLSNLPQSEPAAVPVASFPERESLETTDKVERQDALQKRSRLQLQQGHSAEKVRASGDPAAASNELVDTRDSVEAAESVEADTSTSAFVPQEPEVIEQARNLATREQRTARVQASATITADAANLQSSAGDLCPLASRETAEKWFKCIKAIENTAAGELVDKEYEAFRKRFPDFEDPEVDK